MGFNSGFKGLSFHPNGLEELRRSSECLEPGWRLRSTPPPPPLLFTACIPFPSVWANLPSSLRSSHLLAYFMYNARPCYWSLFSLKISPIFCLSVTLAVWLDSSCIISKHVIRVFWWCLLLCWFLSSCRSPSSLHYISLFYNIVIYSVNNTTYIGNQY